MRLDRVQKLRLNSSSSNQVPRVVLAFVSLAQNLTSLLIEDGSVGTNLTITHLAEG